MKVRYDPATDTLTVLLKEGVAVAESDEERPGTVLDFDADGELISVEILDASRRVTDTHRVEYQSVTDA